MAGNYIISFHILGNVQRLSSFTLMLVGKEKVTYRQGKGTNTEEYVFYQERIYSQERNISSKGEVNLSIPDKIMPSFKTSDNEIQWSINANGEIAYWPDIDNEYPIKIYPNI